MLVYLDTFIGFAVVMLGASLIITILTQTVSAAASFRGSSLRWGLRQLFKNIDPKTLPTIAKYADNIAEEVLTQHITSDSIFSSINWIGKILPSGWVKRFQLASAIRPDELVRILNQWVTSKKLPSQIIEVKPDDSSEKGAELRKEGDNLLEELDKLLGAKNPVAERQIKLLTETSSALSALALDRAPALIEEMVKSVREAPGNLEAWFKTAMDRVSQQFSMYMRTWTVIFSFALAAVTGLDSVQLVRSLYQNGEFRAAAVGEAPNLLTSAGLVLPPGAKSVADAVAGAMTGLYSDAVGKALASAKVAIEAKPQDVKTRDEAEAWIRKNVPDASQQKAALDAFPAAADQAFAEFMQKNAKNASDVKDILTAMGIQILGGWPEGFNWQQFFGVLVSGALLSLGAPFWFNSSKALTNLRPTVAGKLKEEEKKTA